MIKWGNEMKEFKRFLAVALSVVMILSVVPICVSAEGGDFNEIKVVFDTQNPDVTGLTWSIDGNTAPVVEAVAGADGTPWNTWKLDPNSGESYNLRFKVDNNATFDGVNRWFRLPEYVTVDVSICYLDRGYGGFAFTYDSYNGQKTKFVQCVDTNVWEYAKFRLEDVRFADALSGFDFMITTYISNDLTIMHGDPSPYPIYLYDMSIKINPERSAYKLNVGSDNPGNIFFNDEEVALNLKGESKDGEEYDNMRVKYTVYEPVDVDYNDFEKSYPEKNAILKVEKDLTKDGLDVNDRVKFEGLPFGTYVLKTELIGDYKGGTAAQRSVAYTDFSYSRRATEINHHFGTNTHFYDDPMFPDKIEVKKVAELMRNAGYYMIRHSMRWQDIQKDKAGKEREMEEPFLYGDICLHELGMESLNIIHVGNPWYGKYPSYTLIDDPVGRAALKDYAKYVTTQIKPYSSHFCIMNEYDLEMARDPNYGLTWDDIDKIAIHYNVNSKAIVDGVKEAYPEAWINCGSVAAGGSDQDLECYKVGMMDYSDSFSLHRYNHRVGPELSSLNDFIDKGLNNIKTYNPESTMELWVTENGWPTRNFDVPTNLGGELDCTSEYKQAMWYPRSMAIHSDPTRESMFIYYEFQDNYDGQFDVQDNFGTIHARTYRTPWAAKPAYITTCAFNAIVGETVDSKELGNKMTGGGTDYRLCDKMVYELTNKHGEVITCVWKNEECKTNGTYTVETNMPYAEVYDMYGNLIDVVEGGTVNVDIKPEITYVKGVNYPSGEIMVKQNDEIVKSIWCMQEGNNVTVNFTPSDIFEDGDSLVLFAAAYKNDVISYVETRECTYDGENAIEESFSIDDFDKADTLKFFVFDGTDTIRPLAEKSIITGFGDSHSVKIEKDGDVYTITGAYPTLTEGDNIFVTVYDKATKYGVTDETNFGKNCIYQDATTSDKYGRFSIKFKLSKKNLNAAGILVTSDTFSIATTIY